MIICLDTNCVIYLIERPPVWGPKIVARLTAARSLGDTVAVCDLARSECLVGPLKAGDVQSLADYHRFFSSPEVQMLPLAAVVCERAAQIRVASGSTIKLPDALHLAAAIEFGCGLFLTNDHKLTRCLAIPIEVLA